MAIHIGPLDINTECKSIEMHHERLIEAIPGDNVGFCIKGVPSSHIKRGDVASNANDDPVCDTEWFKAQVMVMNHPRI